MRGLEQTFWTTGLKTTVSSWDIALPVDGRKYFLNSEVQDYSDKIAGYIFLKVRKDIIRVNFLERFFESKVWGAVIDSFFKKGGVRFLFRDLESISIPVPSLEIQDKYCDFFSDLEKEQERLSELREQVWFDPSYLSFSPEEKTTLDRFVDVIPYPLANMLHHRENSDAGTDKEKYEIALKFMESVAQYLCACVIGIAYDLGVDISDFLNDRKSRFSRTGASFGYWVWMLTVLRDKITSSGLSFGPWNEYLGCEGPVFGCLKHLDVAREIRNKKVGHGVYPTQTEAEKTLNDVEICLESFAKISFRFFEAVELVRVGDCRCYPGRYEVDVDVFSGLVSYPFVKSRVASKRPLHYNELHIHLKEYETLLQIPRLVILERAVKEGDLEGFYFLSSEIKDSDEFVYVCHQQLPLQWKTVSNKDVNPFCVYG